MECSQYNNTCQEGHVITWCLLAKLHASSLLNKPGSMSGILSLVLCYHRPTHTWKLVICKSTSETAVFPCLCLLRITFFNLPLSNWPKFEGVRSKGSTGFRHCDWLKILWHYALKSGGQKSWNALPSRRRRYDPQPRSPYTSFADSS